VSGLIVNPFGEKQKARVIPSRLADEDLIFRLWGGSAQNRKDETCPVVLLRRLSQRDVRKDCWCGPTTRSRKNSRGQESEDHEGE